MLAYLQYFDLSLLKLKLFDTHILFLNDLNSDFVLSLDMTCELDLSKLSFS